MDHVMRDVSITCLAKDLPDFIDMDVTKLMVGDSLHASDIEMPGIEVMVPGDRVVITVHGKAAEEVEAEEAIEAVEGEAVAPAEGEEKAETKE